MSTSLFQFKVRVFWRDWLICEITRAAREHKKNTKGGEEEQNCYLKFKKGKRFSILALQISETSWKDYQITIAVVDQSSLFLRPKLKYSWIALYSLSFIWHIAIFCPFIFFSFLYQSSFSLCLVALICDAVAS